MCYVRAQFAIHVLNLLAVATEGRNRGTEIQAKALLPIDDLVKIMHDCDGDAWPTIKVLSRPVYASVVPVVLSISLCDRRPPL